MIKSILTRINKFVSDVIDKITHKEPWYKYYDKGGFIELSNNKVTICVETQK